MSKIDVVILLLCLSIAFSSFKKEEENIPKLIFKYTFDQTGEESEDIVVAVSIKQSFEWEDVNADGKYEPANESVVVMGIRGLRATVQ
ncbi:MAG: hypothetical protein ACI9O4_002381 [Chitinophagales bacterium]|jgi:hypothetical protein